MKNLMLSLTLALSITSIAACKKGGSECEQIFDHTLSIVPDSYKDKVSSKKDDAIGKCEKMSPEARKCAMDAANMEDLQKCPHQ